jgi:CRP-like cAMP-binding protein
MQRRPRERKAVTAGRQRQEAARAGDHIILVYQNRADLTAFAVPFINDGLAGGERCVYVTAGSAAAEVTRELSAAGARIIRRSRPGAFTVRPAREFFGLAPFDARRAAERLLLAQTEAASAGFTGLRLVGDWAWSLDRSVQDGELREFESLMERMVAGGGLTVACMYRRDSADPETLERLVRLHATVIASDDVFVSLSELFRGLPPAELRRLARSARARTVRKGECYFRQGEPARYVYLLTSGMVKLVRTAPSGDGVILRVVAPVQHFGDGRIDRGDAVRFASAEALENSRALEWDGSVILDVVLAHPAVAVNVIRWFQRLIDEERSRLEDLISPDVTRRLSRLLLRLGQSIGHKTRRGVVIDVALSRRDLAELVFTSPYTVSRILAEWRRLDLVDALRTRIVIRDQERLATIADEPAAGSPVRPRTS